MAAAGSNSSGAPEGAPTEAPTEAPEEAPTEAPTGGSQGGTIFRGKPLSPWAERFGLLDDSFFFGDGRHHSGLAPLHPKFDALNYSDGPIRAGHVPLPEGDELDKLFISERFQEVNFMGLKSWELGALNENMANLPFHGGHSAKYDHAANFRKFQDNIFKIDESRWFNFLQKYRWLTPEVRLYSNETREHIREWTVENPKIWAEMRILTEWIYRVFDILIQERDPWLDTVLFGDFVQLDGTDIAPNATEPARYGLRPRRTSQMPKAMEYQAQARQRLEYLHRFTQFSFMDEWDHEAFGANPTGATTYKVDPARVGEPGYVQTPVVIPMVHQFRDLCQDAPPELTPAEASFARYHSVITLMHELTHAAVCHRLYERWPQVRSGSNEPYIGDDRLAEAGMSLERHLLGGVELGGRPWLRMALSGETSREKFAFWAVSDREIFSAFRAYNQADIDALDQNDTSYLNRPGSIELGWHAPAFFAALQFTDQYWDDVVGKKGHDALKPPSVCYGTREQRVETLRWYDVIESERAHGADELQAPVKRVRDRLRTQRWAMKEIRPWHEAEVGPWARSVWGWAGMRRQIQGFRAYHARRDFAKCCAIVRLAMNMVLRVIRFPDPDNSLGVHMALTCEVYLKLCCLMAASLPCRTVPAGEDLVTSRSFYRMKDGKPAEVAIDWVIMRESQAITMPSISQTVPTSPMDYLVEVQKGLLGTPGGMLEGPGKPASVAPREWTNALVDTYRDLLRQREKPDMNPQHDWAEFNFDIPPYSRDAAYHVLRATPADLAAGKVSLVEVPTPEDIRGPSVQDPGVPVREIWPETPVACYPAGVVADNEWILLGSIEGFWEIWNPHGLKDRAALLAMFQTMLFLSPNGWTLKPDASDPSGNIAAFRRLLRNDGSRLVGRLVSMLTESEVLEFDGSLSTPLYKVYGDMVFNVTGFLDPATNEEKAVVLSNDPLRPGWMDNSQVTEQVYQRMLPWLCALIRPQNRQPITALNTNAPLLLTWTELRHHDNEDNGIYIAIDRVVYDVTGYILHHPCRQAVLASVAGRDATQAFRQAHHGGFEALNAGPGEHLIRRVGSVVDEWMPSSAIPQDRFALHDFLFPLAGWPSSYAGRDMTSVLTDKPDSTTAEVEALSQLYLDHFNQAVGKKGAEAPNDTAITLAELQTHKDYNGVEGAWVVDADSMRVYDITSLLKFPDFFENVPEPLRSPDPSQIVEDVSDWLRDNLGHRWKGNWVPS